MEFVAERLLLQRLAVKALHPPEVGQENVIEGSVKST